MFALRSLVETIACRRLVQRRNYIRVEDTLLTSGEQVAGKLFAKLQAMRHSLANKENQ